LATPPGRLPSRSLCPRPGRADCESLDQPLAPLDRDRQAAAGAELPAGRPVEGAVFAAAFAVVTFRLGFAPCSAKLTSSASVVCSRARVTPPWTLVQSSRVAQLEKPSISWLHSTRMSPSSVKHCIGAT